MNNFFPIIKVDSKDMILCVSNSDITRQWNLPFELNRMIKRSSNQYCIYKIGLQIRSFQKKEFSGNQSGFMMNFALGGI